ncbi:disease resistance protein RPM1-like [Impatiens glandulifera]|uniref:disease resistance protein RPM1-like n=1 Tax=Impatiens glandulifera TaxID=253017 RepID=UPI001FB150D4|nr:disease resistance protein RPM1-like [Impatiens glandulifera]
MAEHRNFLWLTRFRARHSIATLLEDIDGKIKNIQLKKNRYNDLSRLGSSSSNPYTYIPFRIAPLFVEDNADIVGIEESKDKITSWIHERASSYKVVFVVGMGGSGKTTLARQVYKRVKDEFVCYAWIITSRSPKKHKVLSTMLTKLKNPIDEPTPQTFNNFSEVDLMENIRNHLQGKRYIIVIDGLQVKEIWDSIEHTLPKNIGGTVIVTSQRSDIINSYGHNNNVLVHHIQPLSDDKACELFYKKAFPETKMCGRFNGAVQEHLTKMHLKGATLLILMDIIIMSLSIIFNLFLMTRPVNSSIKRLSLRPKCAVGLMERSKSILQRCEGLPAGIIEIGQSLSNSEKTESEWKRVYDNIGSSSINGHLSNTVRVLSMSCKDVPHYLKVCLLYLSIFPERFPVDCRKLVRLWVAEGLITTDEQTNEVEQIGEGYLKELINRNLVKICENDFDGRPRSCWLHNFMHKIILAQSRDEDFCAICTENTSEKSRRLSVQDLNMPLGRFTSARTVLVLGGARAHHPIMGGFYTFPENINFLKVLELDGVNLDKFPIAISGLLLLRYLSLRSTRIKVIPDTIGNLQYLETLDLKYTLVRTMPEKALAKLTKLRHLFIYSYIINNGYVAFDAVQGFEASSKIVKLTKLRKLAFVKANHELVCALGSLHGLRKLGIIDLQRKEGKNLCSSIKMLTNLCSLSISSLSVNECLDICSIDCPPPLLRRLYLKGCLEGLPSWISKLHDLARVRLKWSKLKPEFNPIDILGSLPNLLELQLLDAYEGQHLHFFAGQFKKLQILDLEQLRKLKVIVMNNGTLPQLSKLIIKQCSSLGQVPKGISKLTQLKKFVVWDMPPSFQNKLKKKGEHYGLVRHIPHIEFLTPTGIMI